MSIRLIRKLERNDPNDDSLQDAVYWPVVGTDNYANPTYGTADRLKVRWEDTTETFTDKSGETRTSRAKVFVGRDLTLLGVLWRGKLADLSGANLTDPFANPLAFQIARFDKIPTLSGRQFLRVAYL